MYDDQQRTAPHASPGGRVFLHQFRHSTGRGSLAIFAAVCALVGLAVAVASITLLLQYRSTAQAQVRQLQAAVSSAQAASQGRASASTVSGLAGKVNAITPVVDGMAPYGLVCAQALQSSSNGAGIYYFPCTPTKP